MRDFEIYNRTALPLLVEANLRAIVESQLAPIEERVRTMVVDIVRTCQSTVARNYHLTVASSSSANGRVQPFPHTIQLVENDVQVQAETDQVPIAGNSTDFFQEPPHLNTGARALLPDSPYNRTNFGASQNPSSDSGYASGSGYASAHHSCVCSCHDYSDTWNTANGEKPSSASKIIS